MSVHSWRDEPIDTRPPSPVDDLADWRDSNLEDDCTDVIAGILPHTDPRLEGRINRIEQALATIPGVMAELMEREAKWRGTSQPPRWFRWGLTEVDAERAAVKEYRITLEQARVILHRRIKERNRLRGEAEREAAEARRAAGLPKAPHPITQDGGFNRSRRDVIAAAFELGRADAADWSPDSLQGLKLRAALAAYEQQLDRLREHDKGGSDG